VRVREDQPDDMLALACARAAARWAQSSGRVPTYIPEDELAAGLMAPLPALNVWLNVLRASVDEILSTWATMPRVMLEGRIHMFERTGSGQFVLMAHAIAE
jgi:hypothetical protein